MRTLIFEHICSGGLAGHPLDHRLMSKGGAMLRALVEDFHAAGNDVTVLLDDRVPYQLPGKIITVDSSNPQNALTAFDRALASVDAALVIAPEFADLLPGWLERVERSGVKNLGSSSQAVRLTSDKHTLAQKLSARGIRMPIGALGLQHAPEMLKKFGEIVVKPNHGAGCIDTFACRAESDLQNLPSRNDWLVQERIKGVAASIALVVSENPNTPPTPLRAGFQTISNTQQTRQQDHQFKLGYSGGQLPLPPDLQQRAIQLALQTLPHLPGLRGMVGLDLILCENKDLDTLIEVNPRPTVAYTGLRQLALFHLPDLILGKPITPSWRPGSVRYQSDGSFELINP
jgi:tyramine---L-glutamate ligase